VCRQAPLRIGNEISDGAGASPVLEDVVQFQRQAALFKTAVRVEDVEIALAMIEGRPGLRVHANEQLLARAQEADAKNRPRHAKARASQALQGARRQSLNARAGGFFLAL